MISYDQFLTVLKSRYPVAARELSFEERLSPLLICPQALSLPKSLKAEAEEIVRAYFALRSLPQRARALEALPPPIADPGNTSALMSYDFHVDAAGHLRLIEINTNASLSLLVDNLHEAHGLRNPFVDDFRTDIVTVFREEFAAARAGGMRGGSAPDETPAMPSIAIVDEKPETQRLYVEFILYRELFTRAGLRAIISDPGELQFVGDELRHSSGTVDIVYNRHTDFYLQTPETASLRSAMEARLACLSPHPHEYRLLADKERLLELSRPGAIDVLPLSDSAKATLKRSLIASREVKDFASGDELWRERKRWFFKPKRSYGGKAAYRAASISKSVFAKVLAGDYLAQEFVPAPEMKMESGETFKYDLRFFVYRDRIQLACARFYQGQMTNTQTAGAVSPRSSGFEAGRPH